MKDLFHTRIARGVLAAAVVVAFSSTSARADSLTLFPIPVVGDAGSSQVAGTLGPATTSGQDPALVITPTFNSSITSLPNAAAIESTINSAIQYYEKTFTVANPTNVSIAFNNMSSGLGQSQSTLSLISYQQYRSALQATASGDSTDTTALAHLPILATGNPVTGNNQMLINSTLARALGFNAPGTLQANGTFGGGTYDGVIGLNTGITTVGNGHSTGPYSLFAVVQHEIDEVLGTGSSLNGPSQFRSNISPEDLFRYNANGGRSYSGDGSAAYFSLDGTTRIAQFNNTNNGADYGDWASNPLPPGASPKVQDAYQTPNATPTLANDGGAEVKALDAIGYNLASTTPEPATLSLVGMAVLTLGGYGWRRSRQQAGTSL